MKQASGGEDGGQCATQGHQQVVILLFLSLPEDV